MNAFLTKCYILKFSKPLLSYFRILLTVKNIARCPIPPYTIREDKEDDLIGHLLNTIS